MAEKKKDDSDTKSLEEHMDLPSLPSDKVGYSAEDGGKVFVVQEGAHYPANYPAGYTYPPTEGQANFTLQDTHILLQKAKLMVHTCRGSSSQAWDYCLPTESS